MNSAIKAGGSPALFFDKLVWSVEDVAKELSISVRHVYRLMASDKIPYCKGGAIGAVLASEDL